MRSKFGPREVCLYAALLGALVCLPWSAYSQATGGNLVGTVADQSGARIPVAQVELVNQATGVKYTAQTGASGDYRFGNLPPGQYHLRVAAQPVSPPRRCRTLLLS